MRGESPDLSARGGTDHFDDSQIQKGDEQRASGRDLGMPNPSMAVVKLVPSRNRVDHFGRATAAYFPRLESLITTEARTAVLRVPEVQGRLRLAQMILDDLGSGAQGDLMTWMLADDCEFEAEPGLHELIEMIVQVALFERYLRFNRTPDWIVGVSKVRAINCASPAEICADLGAFAGAVRASRLARHWLDRATQRMRASIEEHSVKFVQEEDGDQAIETEEKRHSEAEASQAQQVSDVLPVGIGRSLKLISGVTDAVSGEDSTQLVSLPVNSVLPHSNRTNPNDGTREAVHFDPPTDEPVQDPKQIMDFFKRTDQEEWDYVSDLTGSHLEVVRSLNLDLGVSRFVCFGLGEGLSAAEAIELNLNSESGEVTVDNAIDLDPHLRWFWRDLRPIGTQVQ